MKDRDKDGRGRIRERTVGSMEETERDWMRREGGGEKREKVRDKQEDKGRKREREREREKER